MISDAARPVIRTYLERREEIPSTAL